MLDSQFVIFLAVCGVLSGALYATTRIGSAVFVVLSCCLFMPVVNLSSEHLLLPIIGTAIVAMIPMLLVDWLDRMKAQQVDTKALTAFAPGAIMGGVIGAQCVSLVPHAVIAYFAIALLLVVILSAYWQYRPLSKTSKWRLFYCLQDSRIKLPVGLVLSCAGILSASSGKPYYTLMLQLSRVKEEQVDATASAITLFVVMAAMVGFAFPAQPFVYSSSLNLGSLGFVGAIHLVSGCVLAVSQLASFYWCRQRGSHLDRAVVHLAAIVFLAIALARVLVL